MIVKKVHSMHFDFRTVKWNMSVFEESWLCFPKLKTIKMSFQFFVREFAATQLAYL